MDQECGVVNAVARESLLWSGFDHWPGNFLTSHGAKNKKQTQIPGVPGVELQRHKFDAWLSTVLKGSGVATAVGNPGTSICLRSGQKKGKAIHHLKCYTFCHKMVPKINGKDLTVVSWLYPKQDSVPLQLVWVIV